nr:gliding motility-associated ABC transporter ATP-binding subunit GldA [Saprospiraceae bacterium]
MSIAVKNLSKFYGSQAAVDDVSFEVQKGEVVGFLGPNGAGKSTTMKILTCYINQDSGSATVCGLDTSEDSLEVRKKVGYLPEHNPLYKELYTVEFLRLCARFYGISNKNKRIAEVIEMTGLQREKHKKIEALSRGYRQRVGLAQAILHDPEVLILDEPTSGLDPNQIVEIRSLIKTLGKEKTVIFSSHIMQEVEAISDRVLILNKGKLVMDSPIGEISQPKEDKTTALRVLFNREVDQKKISEIPGLVVSKKVKEREWLLKGVESGDEDFRQTVFTHCAMNNFIILEMNQVSTSMEEVFREMTGDKKV